MLCDMCLLEYHFACENGEGTGTCSCPNCRGNDNQDGEALSLDSGLENDDDPSDSRGRHSGREVSSSRHRMTRDSALKDQQSTGRKRAAKMYPLMDAPCEWANKSNCGGGLKPILGCLDGLQQARHHGPDKSVTNNEQGNVHRICHACHYRWHAANDLTYDWNKTDYPSHSPVGMTNDQREEAALIRLEYMNRKDKKRVKD